MKKHVFTVFILTAVALCLSGCKKPFGAETVYSIWIKNESTTAISYLFSYNYPDTTIPDEFEKVRGCPSNTRVPNDSKTKWENVIANEIGGGKLVIFVFNVPVTEQNWQQIRSTNAVAKRYELSAEELKAMNWEVRYP